MDGYIKNKKEAIQSVRKAILGKYLLTLLILILIPFWVFALAAYQSPAEWTHTDLVYSHISQEPMGLQRGRSDVLNDQNGRKFVIKSKYVDVDHLREYLIPGNKYRLIFSTTVVGDRHMQALYDGDVMIQDIEESITRWEREQNQIKTAIVFTVVIEIAALILIDRLWCKKEHARIQKLKEDIKRRKERIGGD